MIQLLFCTSFRFTTLTKDQAGNLNSSLLFLYLYYHGDFCHQNWNYQLQGWIMKQDRIYFAFPSKSEEPAKLLVLVININTLQVTFKDQEDIQNCLRCCTPGAEMLNLDHIYRKPFLDTFHCYYKLLQCLWHCYLLPQADSIQYRYCTPGKMLVGKTSVCFPMCDGRMQVLNVFQPGKLFLMNLNSSLCSSTDHNSDLAEWFSKNYADLIVRAATGKNPKSTYNNTQQSAI